jgi:hypothetical protein
MATRTNPVEEESARQIPENTAAACSGARAREDRTLRVQNELPSQRDEGTCARRCSMIAMPGLTCREVLESGGGSAADVLAVVREETYYLGPAGARGGSHLRDPFQGGSSNRGEAVT